jgi:hypothetical protein
MNEYPRLHDDKLKKYIIIENVGHNNRFPLDITNGMNINKNKKQIPTGKPNKIQTSFTNVGNKISENLQEIQFKNSKHCK